MPCACVAGKRGFMFSSADSSFWQCIFLTDSYPWLSCQCSFKAHLYFMKSSSGCLNWNPLLSRQAPRYRFFPNLPAILTVSKKLVHPTSDQLLLNLSDSGLWSLRICLSELQDYLVTSLACSCQVLQSFSAFARTEKHQSAFSVWERCRKPR
jgi:hypothetical protein